MKVIDNRGCGNCMYYAYAISLMYYLRKQDVSIRDELFKKLQLTDQHIAILCNIILDKNSIAQFSKQDTDNIENILGAACRTLAGENTKIEFLADPTGSSTFSAAVYGIARALKASLTPGYARWIILPDTRRQQGRPAPIEAFNGAEIFKVCGMNAAMSAFSREIVDAVITEFNDKVQLEAFKERRNIGLDNPMIVLNEEQLMEEIIREKTVDFLMDKDCEQLNKYILHLQTDTVWGSEETLLSLHRAIIGEKRNLNNQWITDINISFMILKNGYYHQWQNPEKSHIVINNRGNNHWLSAIPSVFLVPDQTLNAVAEFKNTLEKIIKRSNALSVHALDAESEALKFINMLQEKTVELNDIINEYSHHKMNRFIHDFQGKLNAGVLKPLDRKYVLEYISNFINTSWYLIKLAFATLISIISPSTLEHLQANKPVEYGIKTDFRAAQALFGQFKPVGETVDAVTVSTLVP